MVATFQKNNGKIIKMKNLWNNLGVFWNLFLVICKKLDWQHICMMILFPAGDAFLETIANGGKINSTLLSHAFYVFVITVWAIFKRSPMQDFIKTNVVILGLGLSLSTTACSGSSTPASATPATTANTQAQLKAVANVITDVYNLVGNACVAYATSQNNDAIRVKCQGILIPAHNALLIGAAAIDTYNVANSPATIACKFEEAITEITNAATTISNLDPTIKNEINDVMILGAGIAGICPVSMDGGN
jgi:hypothetical protein